MVQAGRPGTLSFVVSGEPSFLSPAATDESARRINNFLFSTLYRLDASLSPVRELAAADPTLAKDGTWRVALQPGPTFHDGSPIVAADVAFTYALALSPNCPYGEQLCRTIAQPLAAVAAAAPAIVSFRLRPASAAFFSTGLTQLGILPERAVRASYDRFRAAAAAVDITRVRQLTDRIGAATNDQKCLSETPPAECDLAFYAADLEGLVRQAGIVPPEHARFRQPSGALDAAAYASALLDQAEALAASIQSKDADSIAAAFPLLDFQRQPVGSGPYALAAYRPGESVELRRHAPDITGTSPKGARAAILADPSAAATALKTGDVDWLPEISPDEVPGLENDPAVRVAGRPGSMYRAIVFNVRPGRVYAERATRQAFAQCINKEPLITQATSGRATIAWSPTSPASWAHHRSSAIPPFDPAAAQQLLQSAGWVRGADGIFGRRGQRLSSQIYVRPSRADQLTFAHGARDQLRACGIELRVTELGFSGDVLLRQIGWPNDFDTFLAENTTGLDPASDFSIFSSSRVTSQANPGDANYGGWANRDADRLLADGAAQPNRARRRELYVALQDLLAQEIPLYPLWYDPAYAGVSSRVFRAGGEIDPRAPFYDWDATGWQLKAP